MRLRSLSWGRVGRLGPSEQGRRDRDRLDEPYSLAFARLSSTPRRRPRLQLFDFQFPKRFLKSLGFGFAFLRALNSDEPGRYFSATCLAPCRLVPPLPEQPARKQTDSDRSAEAAPAYQGRNGTVRFIGPSSSTSGFKSQCDVAVNSVASNGVHSTPSRAFLLAEAKL